MHRDRHQSAPTRRFKGGSMAGPRKLGSRANRPTPGGPGELPVQAVEDRRLP
jgi:hypothetical protein